MGRIRSLLKLKALVAASENCCVDAASSSVAATVTDDQAFTSPISWSYTDYVQGKNQQHNKMVAISHHDDDSFEIRGQRKWCQMHGGQKAKFKFAPAVSRTKQGCRLRKVKMRVLLI